MPDHKETGREPTDRERETAFAPHHSPDQQADGDPGDDLPPRETEDNESSRQPQPGDVAGKRGKIK
jgi:hypothetical protein